MASLASLRVGPPSSYVGNFPKFAAPREVAAGLVGVAEGREGRAEEAHARQQAQAFGEEMRRLQQDRAQAQAGRRSLAEVMFGEPQQAAPGRREQRRLRRQRG